METESAPMRRRLPIWASVACLAFVMAGCEGPTGPAGPAGPAGAAGPTGAAGPAGQDANETCTQCHENDTRLYARQLQYQNSQHYTGGNFERSTTDCAPCHTNEGFLERIQTGAMATAADIENPSPQNCRTCHQIHTTYTEADFAFTTTAPVNLWLDGAGTVDLGDVGNLCAQCHQARAVSPLPVLDGDDVNLTSSRYGGHHSPVAEVIGGTGLFEFTGSKTIDGGPATHGTKTANPDVCATCHMAQPFGSQAGGHTWRMEYEYHGSTVDNIAGCEDCHSTIDDFGYAGVQASVEAKLDELGTLLATIGIHDTATGTGRSKTGTWPANVAAAFLNYQMILEDKSMGIHNPEYVLNVLTNTIEAMTPLAQ